MEKYHKRGGEWKEISFLKTPKKIKKGCLKSVWRRSKCTFDSQLLKYIFPSLEGMILYATQHHMQHKIVWLIHND